MIKIVFTLQLKFKLNKIVLREYSGETVGQVTHLRQEYSGRKCGEFFVAVLLLV